MKHINRMRELLSELGLEREDAFEAFHPRTRDREDISVLKGAASGALILSQTDHVSEQTYAGVEGFSYWDSASRDRALAESRFDDERRAAQFKDAINAAVWLDFGTGAGGILDLLGPCAAKVHAIELQPSARESLKKAGYSVHADLSELPAVLFDVVTLFHVFEHLLEPVSTLKALRERLAPGGTVIIEVPHATDFLVSFLGLERFKDFTFWSEHLILHTRTTLEAFIRAAGFGRVVIEGCQRYPISNHMHWLASGEPGGHKKWSFLNSEALHDEYSNVLIRSNMCDTLVARAWV
jgi:2-polyprenyl-3-methyl-5-hydroxy-6-metoxy-1,4-benzoquinol methylase